MRQGAVGAVRLVERGGRRLVEKRLADPARHQNQQEEPQPSEDKLQDLQDKLEQGTQERDQQQGDEPGGTGADKPW